MENNFIQMASSTGHAVAYTIGPIFKFRLCTVVFHQSLHEYCPLKPKIFDGIPQIIVQRCQTTAPRWPNDINSAADNAIFKNRA